MTDCWPLQEISLDDYIPVGGGRQVRLCELLVDEHQPSQEATQYRNELTAAVRACVATLEPRERLVITLRFGLDGHERRTLKQIGALLGVTREWVRRLEANAMRILRATLSAVLRAEGGFQNEPEPPRSSRQPAGHHQRPIADTSRPFVQRPSTAPRRPATRRPAA
jgi:hypothetical protein